MVVYIKDSQGKKLFLPLNQNCENFVKTVEAITGMGKEKIIILKALPCENI